MFFFVKGGDKMKIVLIIILCLLGLGLALIWAAVYVLKMLIRESEDAATELEVYTSEGDFRDEVFTSK